MNRFMNFTARVAVPAVVLAAAGMPAFAQSSEPQPPNFQITEGPMTTGGTTSNVVTANRIQGSYTEDFTTTGGTAASGTFSTSALFTATGYSLNDAAVAPVRINGEEPSGYGLYATFSAAGNFMQSGGDRSFTGTSGTVTLFLDPNSNTVTNGQVAPTGTTSDDRILGTSSLLGINSGNIRAGANNGDFRLTFGNFALTDTGRMFFTSPNPFYSEVTIRGNFNNFPIPAVGLTARVGGSANASFALLPAQVPEPGSLALMSVALFGLAAAARRRKS